MEAARVDNELNRRGSPVRALLHLIVIELTEKMTSFMIGTNLISSLTLVMDLKKGAIITNSWGGAAGVALLVGAIIDRTFSRRRLTNIMVCLLAYITGLCMLTMAEFMPMLKPCRLLSPTCTKIRTTLSYISLSVIAVVSGGLKASLQSLVDSQYDDHHDHLKTRWKLGLSLANFLCSLGISYFIGIIRWRFTSLCLLVIMSVGTGLYCCGKSAYQVRPLTQNPNPLLRINRCMLILSWYISCIVFGFYCAQIRTFFVLQNGLMDRFVHGTELPPTLFVCLSITAVQPVIFLLGKFVVPISGRTTNRERDNNFLKRTEIGIVLGLIGITISGIVERKRITVQRHGIQNIGYSGVSVFWVLPQGILYTTIEGLMSEGISEYFEDHWASSLAPGFYMSAVGIGSCANILLVEVVDRITEESGQSWFGRDMDNSRVDKFYWILFAIFLLHLIIFRFFATQIRIRAVER